MYGPITSWTQLVANKLGGENMHDIVLWLQVFSVVPFILACAGVFMLAHGDTRRQGRAALLTIANPLLIWAVVAGAHNEALAVMFAVAGLLFMRKNPFIAGLGIGLAGCAKVSIGLWGSPCCGRTGENRRRRSCLPWHRAPDGLAYVLWQPTAFLQALRNGGYVSVGSWAHPLYRLLDVFMTGFHAKVGCGRHLLYRPDRDRLDALPGGALDPSSRSGQGCRPAAGSAHHRSAHRTGAVGRVADHLHVHTLLVRPACLDAASRAGGQQARQDHADQGHSAVMAYVPGRAIDMGTALEDTATRIRDTVSPIVQLAMVLAVILWWRQPDRPELFPFKKPKASPAEASPTVSVRHPRKAAPRAARRRRRPFSGSSAGQGAGVAA